jgi:hypothetical protein
MPWTSSISGYPPSANEIKANASCRIDESVFKDRFLNAVEGEATANYQSADRVRDPLCRDGQGRSGGIVTREINTFYHLSVRRDLR